VLPLVLMAVGVIFFLRDAGVVSESAELWPVVLIAIGLGIALSRVRRRPAEVEAPAAPAEEAVPATRAAAR
jgi:hypothetical protein